ncbi:Arm DNA-binding domain-containing protein [Silvimonas amylolytica]|uniref:Arm DNA-binding domain-containing protein n=1 Tax=Silvimonas amylolytica TaxID=449663 RepID=UPI0035716CE0
MIEPIIKAAQPREKPYALADGEGLPLHVQPTGAKWWRSHHHFHRAAKILSLGVYGETNPQDQPRASERKRIAGTASPDRCIRGPAAAPPDKMVLME